MTRDILSGPWEETATNFFTLNQKDYLLICDDFGKYPFLFEMPMKTTETTIPKYQQLFTQYSPVTKPFPDNGQPFLSEKFTTYITQQ